MSAAWTVCAAALTSFPSDLAIAAGLSPAALLCELVDPADPKGGIAARDACVAFAREHNLRICTIEALRKWREEQEGASFEGSESAQGETLEQERGVALETQAVAPPASS